MKKLLLIDGNSLMFRAYYATAYSGNLMKNSKGLYTNAIYGFANMMEKVLKMNFTHILMAFDKGKKTFRHELLESYKDGRSAMPDEMRVQIPYLKKYVEVLGIKTLEMDLIEADDIIGTLAHKFQGEFAEIDLLSGDKDLLQLITDKTKVLITRKGISELEKFDKDYLMQTMEVTPSQVKDLKGLMGDASDNLKGIPGVGEKTAIKLIKEYGSLEGIIENKESISGKLGEKIRENFHLAELCKQIATIKCDVELDVTAEDIRYRGFDKETMINFYKDVEFHSFIKRMATQVSQAPKVEVVEEAETLFKAAEAEVVESYTTQVGYKVIENEWDLKDILVKDSYIHLEVLGDNYQKAEPLGFGFVNELGNFFIPFEMVGSSIDLQMYLTDDKYKKFVYHLKQMKVVMKKAGFDICGVEFDLLLAAYVINPKVARDEFRVISSSLGYDDVHYDEEIYSKGAKFHNPGLDKYAMHAVKKAIAIKELRKTLVDMLMESSQYSLYSSVELPLASVLANMEYEGITVDQDLLVELGQKFGDKIEYLEKEIINAAGVEFNISSTKQLGEVLFEKLNLPVIKKTKTGYSTDVDVLDKLEPMHPIISLIKEHRHLTKLKSTYIDGIKEEIVNNKVHTIYKQNLTETGRLSSVSPNLQNISVRTEEGRLIRKLFVPNSDNCVLLGADYSQVELRILAHVSNTQSLIEAFKNNEDIHSKTASDVFGVDEVNSDLRRKAKAINFGIIYGMSAYGLSEGVDMSPGEAKMFIERYYDTYPGIKKYMDDCIDFAKSNGYVETIYKRRRYVPELDSPVYMQREHGRRLAMNAPIQGTAADIIKIAMIKVEQEMRKKKLKSKMLLQVHDELIFEVPNNELEAMKNLVKEVMENAVTLNVPLSVDVNAGKTWYDLK